MNLLTLPSGAIIAAGSYTETATTLTFVDRVVPKNVVPGWQIVNMSVPADFTPQTYTLVDGVLVKIPVPAPPGDAEAAVQGLTDRRVAEKDVKGDVVGGLALRVANVEARLKKLEGR